MRPPQTITVLEPTWSGHAHLPGNLGLMTTLAVAFPEARLHFVGDANQIGLIKGDATFNSHTQVTCHAWHTQEDVQPGWADVRKRMAALQDLPDTVQASDLFVMTSVSATCAQAVARVGWASRSAGVLHGNAGALTGWRSRNPWWRQFDFVAGVDRLVRGGGRLWVLEDRIRERIAHALPQLAAAMHVWPHPLVQAEQRRLPLAPRAPGPVRIGFAGLATLDKGFAEFLETAHALKAPPFDGTEFEFHAIGKLSKSCEHLDQSVLKTPAGAPLPRDSFLERLRAMDYLFVWHHERYYGVAASGVVYDAVSQLIPLIGNRAGQQAHWAATVGPVGLLADDLSQLAAELRAGGTHLVSGEVLGRFQASLQKVQDSLQTPALAQVMRDLVLR